MKRQGLLSGAAFRTFRLERMRRLLGFHPQLAVTSGDVPRYRRRRRRSSAQVLWSAATHWELARLLTVLPTVRIAPVLINRYIQAAADLPAYITYGLLECRSGIPKCIIKPTQYQAISE